MAQYIADRFRAMKHLIPFVGGDSVLAGAAQEVLEAVEKDSEEAAATTTTATPDPAEGGDDEWDNDGPVIITSPAKRRLLQLETSGAITAEERKAIEAFTSISGASGGYNNVLLDSLAADSFLEGPFFWPPRFEYWREPGASCAAATATGEIMSESLKVLSVFYNEDYRGKFTAQSWDLKTNLPKFYNGTPPLPNTSGSVFANESFRIPDDRINSREGGDWVAQFFNFYAVNVMQGVLGFTPSKVQSFFTTHHAPDGTLTLGNVLRDMLVCDFEEVVTCSGHRRHLVISFLIAYVFYWLVASVMRYMGLPGATLLFWVALPPLTLWLAYSMAPTCVGMLPSCLMTDLLQIVDVVLPPVVLWPNSLQMTPGCVHYSMGGPNVTSPYLSSDNTTTIAPLTEQVQCMRSCRDEPFYFRSFESTLAWASCGLDPVACAELSIPYFPDVRNAAVNHSAVLLAAKATGNMDVVHGFSFCFWATLAQAAPWIFIVVAGVIVGVSLLRVPGIIFVGWVQFMMQVAAYTHTD